MKQTEEQKFSEVDLIQKQMKRLEVLIRIEEDEEDEEDIKPEPKALPVSDMLEVMKKLKKKLKKN